VRNSQLTERERKRGREGERGRPDVKVHDSSKESLTGGPHSSLGRVGGAVFGAVRRRLRLRLPGGGSSRDEVHEGKEVARGAVVKSTATHLPVHLVDVCAQAAQSAGEGRG
jgi:hypothetical protein